MIKQQKCVQKVSQQQSTGSVCACCVANGGLEPPRSGSSSSSRCRASCSATPQRLRRAVCWAGAAALLPNCGDSTHREQCLDCITHQLQPEAARKALLLLRHPLNPTETDLCTLTEKEPKGFRAQWLPSW